jgi:RNA polymerase sigma-70 factor (ECF subfamily)
MRLLGDLDAAEECFQEAVLSALATWPRDGQPDNPGAWLTTSAKNHARDAARRRRVIDEKAPLLKEEDATTPDTLEAIADDELRLLFTCCHPALTLENQVALTLKVVAGFTTPEIARAFLAPEPTVQQRIVRAKRTIDELQLAYEVPGRAELPARLAAVLTVIGLLFNEGHLAHEGPLLRVDLQREAGRLAQQLCHLLPREPEAFGLLAVISFSLARAETRTDAQGELLLLSEQDRARWDRALIKEGLLALQRARRLGEPRAWVLQAEIAACHATAPSFERTDWGRILRCYDVLLELNPSPVVALNRAVAVCLHEGPAQALAAIVDLEAPLSRSHLFYALRADFRRRLGEDPRPDLERALALAGNDAERRFLRRQLSI